MSTEWVGQLPAFGAVLALLILPGLPTAVLLRLRGVLLAGGAVVASLASIGGASLVAPLIGMRWSVLPVIVVGLIMTAVAGGLWVVHRHDAHTLHGADRRWAWIGVGTAAVGWTLILLLGIGGASHPSQLFDGLFHLNAVEFILRSGDASPFHMTMVVPGDQSSFYPTLWHALVAVVVPVSGSVTAATNVVTVVVVSVIWPLALASVTSILFPRMRTAAAWAPLAGFGLSVFPLGFLNWGVLYPNLLGMLQVPLVMAFALMTCRRRLVWPQRAGLALLTIAAVGASAMAHPSAVLTAFVLLVPFVAWCGVRSWGGRRTAGRVLIVAGAVALAVCIVVVWRTANVSSGEWLPSTTMAQALGEVAFMSPVGRTCGLLIGPLAAIGIWSVVRMKRWWILWSHAVATFFYLAAVWLPLLSIRSALVGVWYDDATRVGALLGFVGLPLAGLGAAVIWGWLVRLRSDGRRGLVAVVAALVVLLGAMHLVAIANDISFMRNTSFRFDDKSQGLTPDEAKLFAKADRLLGPNSRVIGDPLTGAGLLYAYTGHDVVFPHVSGRYGTDAEFLARSLDTGSPQVCAALEKLDVSYALDFGHREIFENHYTTYHGLHGLKDIPILTEIDHVGDAALFKVTGCR